MQELVLLLTGVAGAASAVAYRRLPRGGRRRRGAARRQEQERQEEGGTDKGPAAGRIRSKIHALAAERDVLGKAISRVRDDPGLDEGQKGALLEMYQQQLGTVLAKIDRLEEASRYPDIGPVGDGLIALMDQKLSSLDERLHEISARMAAAAPAAAGREAREAGPRQAGRGPPGRRPGTRAAEKAAVLASTEGAAPTSPAAAAATATAAAAPGAAAGPDAAQKQPSVRPVEITTLTTINGSKRKFPAIGPAAEGREAAPGGPRLQEAAGEAQGAAPQGDGAASAGAAEGGGKGAGAGQSSLLPSDVGGGAAEGGGKGTGAGPEAAARGAKAAGAAARAPSLPPTLPRPPAPVAASGGAHEPEDAAGVVEDAAGVVENVDDDLAAIMADIRSTLSKLEQAEVE